MATDNNNDLEPAHAERWPYARLFGHISQKGFQAGSLLSSCLVSPALMFRAGRFDWEILLNTSGKGAAIGVVLAGDPVEKVEDRVYRLYYNEGQNRCDTFAQAGIAVGLATALLRRGQSGVPYGIPWGVIGHAAVGAAAGVIAHGVTAPKRSAKVTMKAVSDSIDKMS